jgi:hypothetical protein
VASPFFLVEIISLKFFATLSVKINAMVPPRAKEIRFLSFLEPQLVELFDTDTAPSRSLTEETVLSGSITNTNNDNNYKMIPKAQPELIYSYYDELLSCMQGINHFFLLSRSFISCLARCCTSF